MKMSEKNLSRRTFVVGGAAAAAAASLALAGCSGGSSTQSGGESGGSAEPAEGGALTAACGYSSTNVDPVDLNGGSALMLAATWHVFEGLYDLDVHTYETYPALAAGEPTRFPTPTPSMRSPCARAPSSPTAPTSPSTTSSTPSS